MKKTFIPLLALLVLLTGCGSSQDCAQVAATTLPVYDFTTRICDGTPISVTRLVTEPVSCLHDYSLNVNQVKAAEAAELVVISGAGLEGFLDDVLANANTTDASQSIELLCPENAHDHDHGDDGHHHESDPHIWLSPAYAKVMAQNIFAGLSEQYPQYTDIFEENLTSLTADLDKLDAYGQEALAALSCREIITFHDGFAYFADAFHLTILEAVEEESGREASAQELIHLIEEVEHHSLPAIFTEVSGSVSASSIISRETGCAVFPLDMAMAGDSYFDAMYHNIDTIQEALQ